jgi:hypothetical protein
MRLLAKERRRKRGLRRALPAASTLEVEAAHAA